MPTHDACSWLSSWWVATVPCHISCLLMMPIFGSPGSECLAISHACSWCLCLALQIVSGYCLIIFYASLCLFLALQSVSAAALLVHFMPAHMPVLDSPDCKWSLCLFIFHACNAYSWLSREWVPAVTCYISCLIMRHVFDSTESEWLLCLAIFYACSWLTLQPVSGFLPHFIPAHDASAFLFRKCVDAMSFLVFNLIMMPVFAPLQKVTGCNTTCVSHLLMMFVFVFLDCE